MTKSRKDIQKQSDQRRGVKNKSFKIPLETIAIIDVMRTKEGISGAQLLIKMAKLYQETHHADLPE